MSETLWAVVLGALLGLPVLALQQWFAGRERERERKMSLRRDVYLEAAEAIASQHQFFLRFADVNLPIAELGKQGQPSGWLSKIHAIGSLATIQAFTDADTALGSSAFELFRLRNAVESLSGELQAIENSLAQARGFHGWLIEMSKTTPILEAPDVAQARVEWFRQALARVEQDIAGMTERESYLLDSKLAAQTTLLREAISKWVAHRASIRKCVLALREEMDLPISAEEYEGMMERSDKYMHAKFQTFLKELAGETEA